MAGWCSSPGRRGSASRRWSSSCSVICRTRRWFWGACDGLFTPRPLGPLFDIAAKLGGELLELCRADAPREELFSALLRQVSEPGALQVLVVEDIHWADEATIDLLRFLGRGIRDAPVLLIATYRDDGPEPRPTRSGSPSATWPPSGRSGGSASRRCPRTRCGCWPATSGLDAAELYRLTGGNPFYVTEVVQSGMGEVPASARDAVLARVSRLSPAAREVLDAAALIGTRVEVAAAGRRSPRGPPSTADELLASGLLAGDGVAVSFRHEIVRMAVAGAIPPLRCGFTHARILGALQRPRLRRRRPAGLPRRGGRGRPRGAAATPRRRAPGGPAGLATGRPPPSSSGPSGSPAGWMPPRRPGCYDGLAAEAGLLDRWQDAADARERALALWREAGDRRREGATLRQLSRDHVAAVPWRRSRAPRPRPPWRCSNRSGPSAELAWAYANLAGRGRWMTARTRRRSGWPGGPQAHRRVARRARGAQRRAQHRGLRAWPAGLATGPGLLRARAGDRGLRSACRRRRAGRSRTSTASTAASCGSPRPSGTSRTASAYCDEHDITHVRHLPARRATPAPGEAGQLGRVGWRLSLELLSRSGASPINRHQPADQPGQDPGPPGRAGSLGAPRRGDGVRGRDRPSRRHPARSGWPGPRRTGSRAKPRRAGAKPSWPTTCPPAATPGSVGRDRRLAAADRVRPPSPR